MTEQSDKVKYLVVGHGHVQALRQGANADGTDLGDAQVNFLPLGQFGYLNIFNNQVHREFFLEHFKQHAKAADAVVLCLAGNQYNGVGLLDEGSVTEVQDEVSKRTEGQLDRWLGLLLPAISKDVAVLGAPPPVKSSRHINQYPGGFRRKLENGRLRSSTGRLSLWKTQMQTTENVAEKHDVRVIGLPDEVFGSGSFLASDCISKTPANGNEVYGARVLGSIFKHFAETRGGLHTGARLHEVEETAPRPDYVDWQQAVSELDRESIAPVTLPKFLVTGKDEVAVTGDGFAAQLTSRLRAAGIGQAQAQQESATGSEETTLTSGCLDGVYTSRQLLQLFERAFGEFQPAEQAWQRADGRYCDAFRPYAEQRGHGFKGAAVEAADKYLSDVRNTFKALDVVVVTLASTECWQSRTDGTVFPVAPAEVQGNTYNAAEYEHINLSVQDVMRELRTFARKLRQVNPGTRIVFAVSPEPTGATGADEHVLTVNTHAKSVLQVAINNITNANASDFNDYFPALEIVTGPHAGSDYFESDRRRVNDQGLDHVTSVFQNKITDVQPTPPSDEPEESTTQTTSQASIQSKVASLSVPGGYSRSYR